MRRRDLIAGLGSLAVLGGGAGMAFNLGDSQAAERVEPLELETLDAPGSTAGSVTVPEEGRVTFLKLFATWCTVCQSMMAEIAALHDSVGEDVQFLSVTNEPLGQTTTAADVADWWTEHDGNWTVAVDDDLKLTQRLDATGVPYSFILDEQNRVVWQHRGRSTAPELEAKVREHL